MRGHSGIGAVQISVGNVVVLVPDVQRGAVELLSGAEHPPVAIEESAATGDKWLDMAVVEEIHLRAYRAPTRAMGICEPAIWSVRVTNHRPRNHLRNVAYGNEPTRKEQARIATLDLVQMPIRCFTECMSGRELLRKPDGVLVISWTLLGTNGASTEHAQHCGSQQQHCADEHPALPVWKYRAYVAAQQQSNRRLPATFFAELGYHELHARLLRCCAAIRANTFSSREPYPRSNYVAWRRHTYASCATKIRRFESRCNSERSRAGNTRSHCLALSSTD